MYGDTYEKYINEGLNLDLTLVKWGDTDAMFNLASFITWRDTTQKLTKEDGKKAVGLYELAARGGNYDAMLDLGAMYLDGRGVRKNEKKALAYYNKAASAGYPKAFRCVGNFYRYDNLPDGTPVSTDDKKRLQLAYDSYVKGSLFDEPNCLYELGDMYRDGICVNTDYNMAFQLYAKAFDILDNDHLDDSYSDVCLRLAMSYHHGYGVEKNLKAAKHYIIIACIEIDRRKKEGDAYGASAESLAHKEWAEIMTELGLG